MKRIVINRYGELLLNRAGQLKKQYCPNGSIGRIACGDWCPKFNEPVNVNNEDKTVYVELEICSCIAYAYKPEEFEDQRNYEN